ncbi:hypothetical protein NUSPORA_02417 [Nucleospora cyclopteri]
MNNKQIDRFKNAIYYSKNTKLAIKLFNYLLIIFTCFLLLNIRYEFLMLPPQVLKKMNFIFLYVIQLIMVIFNVFLRAEERSFLFKKNNHGKPDKFNQSENISTSSDVSWQCIKINSKINYNDEMKKQRNFINKECEVYRNNNNINSPSYSNEITSIISTKKMINFFIMISIYIMGYFPLIIYSFVLATGIMEYINIKLSHCYYKQFHYLINSLILIPHLFFEYKIFVQIFSTTTEWMVLIVINTFMSRIEAKYNHVLNVLSDNYGLFYLSMLLLGFYNGLSTVCLSDHFIIKFNEIVDLLSMDHRKEKLKLDKEELLDVECRKKIVEDTNDLDNSLFLADKKALIILSGSIIVFSIIYVVLTLYFTVVISFYLLFHFLLIITLLCKYSKRSFLSKTILIGITVSTLILIFNKKQDIQQIINNRSN